MTWRSCGLSVCTSSPRSSFIYLVEVVAQRQGQRRELRPRRDQFMSAGTGVSHSEANHGGTPLRFVQSTDRTRSARLDPVYGMWKRRASTASISGPTWSATREPRVKTPKCRSSKICICSPLNSVRPSASTSAVREGRQARARARGRRHDQQGAALGAGRVPRSRAPSRSILPLGAGRRWRALRMAAIFRRPRRRLRPLP